MITDSEYIVKMLEAEIETLPERKSECLQHLTELGYIPVHAVNNLQFAAIEKAKKQFIEDAKASGLFSFNDLLKILYEEDDDTLTDLLRMATDIDEGFRFRELPAYGTENLTSRIIHYRLDVFGMWDQAVGLPYSLINSKASLDKIGEYAKCNALEALNHLSDIEGFTKHLLNIYPDDQFILSFQPKSQVPEKLMHELRRTGPFRDQLLKDFGERNEFFKFLKQEIFNKKSKNINFGFLEADVHNEFKLFMLRLIQVHQWQDGFYDGLLDSDIGGLTLQSFFSTIELYNKADGKDIQPHRVLTHVGENFFLFNGLFFLKEYMVEKDKPEHDPEAQMLNSLLKDINEAGPERASAFQKGFDQLKNDIREDSIAMPEEKKGLIRRIYYGIKRLLKKIVRIARNVFNWIVEKAKKVWNILKTVFGSFFEKLKKAIKAFVDGVKFLFGNKEITTTGDQSIVSSKMRLDGDSFTLALGDIENVIQKHRDKWKYSIASLKFSMEIVTGVLKIIMNVLSVLGWAMLILTLIKVYKNITEAYKELQLAIE